MPDSAFEAQSTGGEQSQEANKPNETSTSETVTIPEKFQMKGTDGTIVLNQDAILKSYVDLEKDSARLRNEVSARKPGESLDDYLDQSTLTHYKLPKDDPKIQKIAETLKANKIGVAEAKAILPTLIEQVQPVTPQPAWESLGEGHQDTMQAVGKWANDQRQANKLSDDAFKALRSLETSPEGVKLLTEMVKLTSPSAPPTALPDGNDLGGSEEERLSIGKEMADPRFLVSSGKYDEAYRASVEAKFARLFPKPGSYEKWRDAQIAAKPF